MYNPHVPFTYTPEVREQLLRHGLSPAAHTDPRFVRAYLSQLYRFEIRRLKRRLLRREFPQTEYIGRVRALRREYVLLSIPIEIWTATSGEHDCEHGRHRGGQA